jgi:AraC-like DNA-binding protein
MAILSLYPPEEPQFFSRQITGARRFYIQLNEPWDDPLVVVSGGDEQCAPNYRVDRPAFPYHAIEFVAMGEGTLEIGGKSRPIKAGAVFGYRPNELHCIRSDAEKPLEKYFLTFAGKDAGRWLATAVPKATEIRQSAAPQHIVQLFEELISAGRNESQYRAGICRALAECIILRIAETAVPLGTVETEAFGTYVRCREWIQTNYLSVKSLDQIGELCHVHPAYICRLFKRFAPQSPWQLVLQLKMRDAATRLQTQQLMVKEVAYEFGFKEVHQFSRTFRRVLGLSPRQFIELQRRHRLE